MNEGDSQSSRLVCSQFLWLAADLKMMDGLISTGGSRSRRRKGAECELELGSIPPARLLKRMEYLLSSGAAAAQGRRDTMEDAHVRFDDALAIVPSLSSSFKKIAFYGVYDGHGGVRRLFFGFHLPIL